jgi:hypothetical protein
MEDFILINITKFRLDLKKAGQVKYLEDVNGKNITLYELSKVLQKILLAPNLAMM